MIQLRGYRSKDWDAIKTDNCATVGVPQEVMFYATSNLS
jgi:hypothetical protein